MCDGTVPGLDPSWKHYVMGETIDFVGPERYKELLANQKCAVCSKRLNDDSFKCSKCSWGECKKCFKKENHDLVPLGLKDTLESFY